MTFPVCSHLRSRAALAGLTALMLAACGGSNDSDDDVEVSTAFTTPNTAKTFTTDGYTRVAATGEIVVLLREDVTEAEYDAVLEALRDRGVTRAGFLRDLRALQVTLPPGADELAAATEIAALPGVRHAGLNELVTTERPNPPRTSTLPQPLALERPLAIDPEGNWWRTAINLSTAHGVEDDLDIATGPLVAVVDTGLLPGQTFIDAARLQRVDAQGQPIPGDIGTSYGRGHGTAVAAFALGNSADAAGVSRHARLLSIDVPDVCGAGDDDWLGLLGCSVGAGPRMFDTERLTGLNTALASEARIVNASWGDTSLCSDSTAVQQQARIRFASRWPTWWPPRGSATSSWSCRPGTTATSAMTNC